MSRPTSRRASAAGVAATSLALLVGCAAGVLYDLRLFSRDDTCPQWEDEGPMAAPGSPYSLLLCGPDDPPLVWATYAGCLLALAVAGLVLLRPPVRRWVGAGLALLVLVLPTATVAVLHETLPRDCLSGDPDSADCVRDRELR